MIHYIIESPDGRIIQRGHCQSETEVPSIDGHKTTIVDPSDARRPAAQPQPVPADFRRMQYPSIGDQLDALWKAIAPLVSHPEALQILEKIQAVKDANPK